MTCGPIPEPPCAGRDGGIRPRTGPWGARVGLADPDVMDTPWGSSRRCGRRRRCRRWCCCRSPWSSSSPWSEGSRVYASGQQPMHRIRKLIIRHGANLMTESRAPSSAIIHGATRGNPQRSPNRHPPLHQRPPSRYEQRGPYFRGPAVILAHVSTNPLCDCLRINCQKIYESTVSEGAQSARGSAVIPTIGS